MNKEIVVLGTLALFLSLGSYLSAYEAIPFRNGGSIQGTAEFAGAEVPKDPILTLTSEAEYCGASLPAGKYLIKDRKIQNVVVFLTGIRAGKAIPSGAVTVTTQKCEFKPHVAVGYKGRTINLRTDDPVLHAFDVHASVSGKELFHVSLHEKGSVVAKTLTRTGLLDLSCYVHPWQHAYLYVFDHPYVAITDENGRFTIDDVPPGMYTIEAWHEALGSQRSPDVQVRSGKSTMIKLEYR